MRNALYTACAGVFLSLTVPPGYAEENRFMQELQQDEKQDVKEVIDSTDEMTFISELGQTAIGYLSDKTITNDQRRKAFKKLFKGNFDTSSIGDFVLGRYKRRASEEELAKFKLLFEEHIADVYANRLKDYNNETFKVTRTVTNKNGGTWVLSKIIADPSSSRPPLSIKWLVFKGDDGQFRIYDAVVEGVSMSITQRSEYAATIQREGGKISGLNAVLERKLSRTAKQRAS